MKEFGLCKDEFIANNNWPYQLYVREARRLRGEYVINQADIELATSKPDPIAVGTWPIERHHVQRYVSEEGIVLNEGHFYRYDRLHNSHYQIPYRALLPRRSELTNLLVPVAVSSTHVAFSAIRVEPLFMAMGQAAGIAANLASDRGVGVHEVEYQAIATDLLKLGAVLE